MKRIIKNYSTLSPELKQLMSAEFPDGITAKDVVSFRDIKGNRLHGVEFKTEDTLYLIKVEGILERVAAAAAAEDTDDWEGEPNEEGDDWEGEDDSSENSNNEKFDEDRHSYE
jgi:hypothetical protein